MDIDKEIAIGELEARMMAQKHSRILAELEAKRLTKRISELGVAVSSLNTEIEKTAVMIAEAKGATIKT